MTPDLIITNARILTMEPDLPRAEALAIAGERLLAVGGVAEVQALAGAQTRVIDARGATVLPGFIEAHMHLFGGGATLSHCQLMGTKGVAALTAKVRAYAAENPGAKVLYCQGAD
ncbi:amidohydrolase family protein [Stagnihabitans tardus]|uniref:Amidohydrolase family protein n=1 Tax=Stagnihabitans tardus TaxID=2699202 RepID=A0AAE4YCC2_9RHOB|nr:amidohydrolase family protein [Stagnihabitans tardus]NBZ89379.1 amidohydrolase family protein [Stagnihabitans tardus]